MSRPWQRSLRRLSRIPAVIGRRSRHWIIARRGIGPGIDDRAYRTGLATIGGPGSRLRRIPTALFRGASGTLRIIGGGPPSVALWEGAVRARPDDADRWLGLATALETTGPPGPVMIGGVGLTRRPTAARESAEYALQRSVGLRASVDGLVGLAEMARRDERLVDAVDHATHAVGLVEDDPRGWIALARAHATLAQRAGGLTHDDVATIRRAWSEAHRLGGPTRPQATFHLTRHLIRFAHWTEAFQVADPKAAPASTDPDALESLIDDDAFTPQAEWWYVAWWRLQSAGRTRRSWGARRREAAARLGDTTSRFDPIDTIRTGVRSLVVMDRLDAALDLVDDALRISEPTGALKRLRADLLLRSGDPGELVDWTARHDSGLPLPPERRFSELVTGRRAAVIGPNASIEVRAEAASWADVLIDTKRLVSDHVPSTTAHISYYADTSAALHADAIADQLADRTLDLAVLRPTAVGSSIADHPGVRIMATEDSLSMGVSHFGIPRIVYDLLRYRPRSLALFGVDLFTAPTAYPDAYRRDAEMYDRAGFARVLSRFNHDLADDFMMLSALLRHGLVDVDDVTGAVLRLDLEQYLGRVDEADRRVDGAAV